MGISEDAFWDMLPREFSRRLDAYRARLEAEQDDHWNRTLFIVNAVRMSANKKNKPLTLEGLRKRARNNDPAFAPTKAEIDEAFARLEHVRATGTRRLVTGADREVTKQ